ncbi:MAG: hypothetical protein ACRDZW_08055 [Acidimicrobiales bacterium]
MADDEPITRATIEAKLRQIRDEVDTTTDAAKPYALVAGVAVAVLVVGLTFLLGRRRGRRKTTFVEVRRV